MTDYRCVNGHDACGEMYAGTECPYCEHRDDKSAALERLKAVSPQGCSWIEWKRAWLVAIRAHIAALEARAEALAAQVALLRAALEKIDGAVSAGITETDGPARVKADGDTRIEDGFIVGQFAIQFELIMKCVQNVCREALAAAPAAPDHPEKTCGDCGRANPVWFASSELWNTVIGGPDGIICPMCFIARAEQNGVVPSAWVVQPDAPAAPEKPGEDLRAIKKALSLAVTMLARNEPGDSRAVSDEFVAIAAVHTGDTSEPVMRVIDAALEGSHD